MKEGSQVLSPSLRRAHTVRKATATALLVGIAAPVWLPWFGASATTVQMVTGFSVGFGLVWVVGLGFVSLLGACRAWRLRRGVHGG